MKQKRVVGFVLLLILLCIESSLLVFSIEVFAKGSVNYGLWWMLSHKKVFLLTVLILDIFAAFLISITNRIWIGNSIFITIFLIFGFATKQKLLFRQQPIFPSDLTLMNEVGSLIKMVNAWGIFLLLGVCLIIVMLNFFIFRIIQSRFHFSFPFWTRIVSVLVTSVLVASFFRLNHVGSTPRKLFAKFDNEAFFWDPLTAVSVTGPVLTFINNLDFRIMDQPEKYTESEINLLQKKYESVSKDYNKSRTNSDINKQTLVYILSESFSDPTRVPNLSVNQDPMKNIRAIKANNTSGMMLSSGYGGGTANMEYMVNTSLNLNFFVPTLTVPYTQLVPNQEKAYAVTDLFQIKNAIHTNTRRFYRREEVYKKFGFQTFRTLDSNGNERLKYKTKIQKSNLVGDDQAYKDTLWQINKEKSGQFISTVTMQNHMPYTDKYKSYDYKASGTAITNNSEEVNHYIQGIHLTDKSTKRFIEKVDKIKKPVTVMWYGDHLAGIYPGNNMQEYNIPMHETDYFIYSNKYARKHGYGFKKISNNSKVVGSNTLTALTLKQLNQKVTPYYALISRVLEELPAMARDSQGSSDGLMVDERNKRVDISSFTSEQKQIFNDYRLIQYDLTAGKHYLSNDFMTKIAK